MKSSLFSRTDIQLQLIAQALFNFTAWYEAVAEIRNFFLLRKKLFDFLHYVKYKTLC